MHCGGSELGVEGVCLSRADVHNSVLHRVRVEWHAVRVHCMRRRLSPRRWQMRAGRSVRRVGHVLAVRVGEMLVVLW